MQDRLFFGLAALLGAVALIAFPWLAWNEAERQAHEALSETTNAYAHAVLNRADKTAIQAQTAITRLLAEKNDPCSPRALALMRHLDLSSTYLQAVGYVRDGSIHCSSMGTVPFALGKEALRTSTGVGLYLDVQTGLPSETPLFGMVRDSFAVLIHRDLPLDISMSMPDASLAVLHLESSARSVPELAKGYVDRKWLARLAGRREATFIDQGQMVAVVRSTRFLIAAVAAVPVAHVEARTRALAYRLVPAGGLAGLAVAVALLSLVRRQRSIASALRHGLRRNEFHLQYQPIIDLATGRCVGAEALLRWQRSTGESIPPELFIPIAEQTGIVTRLTERVLQLAEDDAGAYLAAHPDFHVAINLSSQDLQSTAIVDLVDRFFSRSGARAANLIVEITERGFLDMENAVRVIAALRARGIGVAIDDFGTGYSSLSYLETLDLDFLKIDRSFIEAIGTGAPTSQVVGHIIAMARTMGLRMIAEGIETRAQADFLKAHAVQYGQGWLFGKPMPFTELVRLGEALGRRQASALSAA